MGADQAFRPVFQADTVPTPAGEIEMEAVGSGTQVYLRSELLQGGLPEGDEWFGFDLVLGHLLGSRRSRELRSELLKRFTITRSTSFTVTCLGLETNSAGA
jgi:hypothetical protein